MKNRITVQNKALKPKKNSIDRCVIFIVFLLSAVLMPMKSSAYFPGKIKQKQSQTSPDISKIDDNQLVAIGKKLFNAILQT